MTDQKSLVKTREQAQDVVNVLVRCELVAFDDSSMWFLDNTPPSIEAAATAFRQLESKSESPNALSQQLQTCKRIVNQIRETRPKAQPLATLLVRWPPAVVYENDTSGIVRDIALNHIWYSLPLFVEPPFPTIWETESKINVLYDRKAQKNDIIVDRQSFYSSLTDDEKLELIARPLGGRFPPSRLNRALRESILRKFVAQTQSYQALTPEEQAAWNKMPTFGHRITDFDTETVREDIGI